MSDAGPSDGGNLNTELISEGKNARTVKCRWCPSTVLRPGVAVFDQTEMFLPFVQKKADSGDPTDGEQLRQFWLVDDMYKFENMGFSNTVGRIKYLCCAECELGPIGLHNLDTKISYVAVERVNHE